MEAGMPDMLAKTRRLMELSGIAEMPFGLVYAKERPEGFGPKDGELLNRVREEQGLVDWKKMRETFSCLVCKLWLARKKRTAAWISREQCGCMGGGYYTGLYSPWMRTIEAYVSTGNPVMGMEGERYMPSPASMRAFLAECSPPPAPAPYCVLKPLDCFSGEERPLVVAFFGRFEALCGLFSLAVFATGDAHAVQTPFGAGCSSLVGWPLVYQARGELKAVLGGFDPSQRRGMKPDEMSFAFPAALYAKMLACLEESALPRQAGQILRTRARASRRAWGEEA